MVGVCLGIAADRLIVVTSRILDVSRPQEAHAAPQPAFSGVGNRIIVPDTSPLRTLLTMAAPTMKDVSRT